MFKAILVLFSISTFNAFSADQNRADFKITDIEQLGTTANITIDHDFKQPVSFKFIPSVSCQETFPMYCRGKVVSVPGQQDDLNGPRAQLQLDFAELYGYPSDFTVEVEAEGEFFFLHF
jgi:hypothetical protein